MTTLFSICRQGRGAASSPNEKAKTDAGQSSRPMDAGEMLIWIWSQRTTEALLTACSLGQELLVLRRKIDIIIYHGLRALQRYDLINSSWFAKIGRVSGLLAVSSWLCELYCASVTASFSTSPPPPNKSFYASHPGLGYSWHCHSHSAAARRHLRQRSDLLSFMVCDLGPRVSCDIRDCNSTDVLWGLCSTARALVIISLMTALIPIFTLIFWLVQFILGPLMSNEYIRRFCAKAGGARVCPSPI